MAAAAPVQDSPPKIDAPPGDPAPQSDSESHPFAKIGSVTFRNGKVDVRFGRKVKSVHPRLTLAAEYDLRVLRKATVVLSLRIDETGKVVSADILRSSGTNQLDLPTQQAMYEWWFEPSKDKDGKPVPDILVFTMGFIW
jgi:TonB family protein